MGSGDVAIADATGRPSISNSGDVGYSNHPGSNAVVTDQTGRSRLQGAGTLNVKVPVHQGGQPHALVRGANALRDQGEEQAVLVERSVAARSRCPRDVACGGRRGQGRQSGHRCQWREARRRPDRQHRGDRTILEVLNAKRELLYSAVLLVKARRDACTRAFDPMRRGVGWTRVSSGLDRLHHRNLASPKRDAFEASGDAAAVTKNNPEKRQAVPRAATGASCAANGITEDSGVGSCP